MWASRFCWASAVDHRADVGGQAVRHADAQFLHRALQHLDGFIGDVFLQEQHAQRRAALAGAVEGRAQHVLHHLLRQRRGIDDQGVLAAGFGDQRNVAALGSALRPACG
jgi:hypothetical protein